MKNWLMQFVILLSALSTVMPAFAAAPATPAPTAAPAIPAPKPQSTTGPDGAALDAAILRNARKLFDAQSTGTRPYFANHGFDDDGSWDNVSWPTDSSDTSQKSELLVANPDKGTFCRGVTFECFSEALDEDKLKILANGPYLKEMQTAKVAWYSADRSCAINGLESLQNYNSYKLPGGRGDLGTTQAPLSLDKLNDVKPGDIMVLNRESTTHCVIFLGWVTQDKLGNHPPDGVIYVSSQNWPTGQIAKSVVIDPAIKLPTTLPSTSLQTPIKTDGAGVRIRAELFTDFTNGTGTLLRDKCYYYSFTKK